MDHVKNDDDEHEHEHDEYESDGGTKYIKDHRTGNWIHEALVPLREPKSTTSQATAVSNTSSANSNHNPKKNKKAKFSKKNAKLWIYVTGLPLHGISVDDVSRYFSKAGLLDLDPETLQAKIKLYKTDDGSFKGDASICYARSESVELALQILDESVWDEQHTLSVQRAKFEEKKSQDDSSGNPRKRKYVSDAKRKVAKLALLQAQDDGFGGRLAGGRKGLCIVVVKHMVDDSIPENRLEETLREMAEEYGPVEKITWISQTRVAILKFKEPTAASEAVTAWNGKSSTPEGQYRMEAIYWDGVTDYTSATGETKKDEEHRHEEFGKWIETQELPPELQLQIEEH
jgi:RNA recognition motif-containing protein